jgi:BirA family biotin operon repressor/biotin-[acetyl-CoA-carboxylase] ligase
LSSSLPETRLPDELGDRVSQALPRLGRLGANLHYFPSVTSTNDIVATLAARGAPDGTTIVADMQTSGRGRRGRTWYSPPGAGLYVSILFRSTASGSALTMMAGVALAEAIVASTGLAAAIKWPNDLVAGGRKLAGILAEAAGASSRIEHIVLGFGVNVARAAYPREIADRATSIEQELGRPADRGLVLAEALASIATHHAQLAAGGFDAILARWRELSPSSRGARVEWTGPDGPLRGTTAGVDDQGALLVRVDSRVERIIGGELKWQT